MRRYLFTRYMWVLLLLGGVPVIISFFFTISHYLQALTPEKSAIPPGMFELYGQMPSLPQCWITFFVVLSILIGVTVFLVRRYECKYSEI